MSDQRAAPYTTTSPSPGQIVPPELPGINSLLTLAVAVVVVGALYLARDVLVPVTLAILLSFLLAPLVSVLRRAHLGRTPSVLIAVILALGVLLSLGSVIGGQIGGLANNLPQYETTMRTKIDTLRRTTLGSLAAIQQRFGSQFDHTAPAPASHLRTPPSGTVQNPVTVQVEQPALSPLDLARQILGPILGPLGTTVLVLVVSIFILLQQEDLRDRLIRLFGSSDLHRTTLAMNDAARRLSKYFLTQLAINAGFGLIVGAGLWIIGVPSPVLWGLLGTLARFVPYVGTVLAAGPPVLLAAAIDPGWSTALWTLGMYAVSEGIVGQVVEPFAYGHSTGLSPVSVVIAAIFWTWIWGAVGLLLSTPLTLCLVVLGRHVKRMEFLDVLLGDRPALTPIESLYQRMLANDPDEAATQAETLLRDRSLSAYYDEVALKSLLLAANDVARGVLSRDRQLVMRDTICGLIDDLEDHDDAAPAASRADDGPATSPTSERALPRTSPTELQAPPHAQLPPNWRSDAPVLCLGGRGPLDDAAAAMLSQLLRKHGLGARMAAHDEVGRTTINTLDLSGAAAICISYMEATGSPAHLRFLLRRLRQRIPRAPLILCLWELADAPDPGRDLRLIAGADSTTHSLRDATNLCLEAAHRVALTEEDVKIQEERAAPDPGSNLQQANA